MRENLENSIIRNVQKALWWENQVSIYKPRLSGYFASSKWSSRSFFIKQSSLVIKWPFRMNSANFAWLCEIKNLAIAITAFWSISHDCAKFLHYHAKWKYLIFKLSFVIYSISFSWFHFNYLQINSKSQSKLIALLLSLCIWIIINFICFLQFD